jgi:uracil phosphoribosyltransferase
MTKNVFVLDHPLTGGFLKLLRDKDSSPEVFRKQAQRLGHLLAIEATRDLNTKAQSLDTPLCETQENVVSDNIALAPILRAGIGLVDPFLDLIPEAHVHFLGMYRDEQTHDPVAYYNKLPTEHNIDVAYVLDPMLATGGSAIMTIEALQEWGVKKIKFIGLIGAPEGVKALHDKFPKVDIHLAALDEKLNESAYIVPGLGDAGDRIFNS